MSVSINGMSITEYIQKQREEGEIIESVIGRTETKVGSGTTIIRDGHVTITRKGKTYRLIGNLIIHRGDEWYVDGRKFDFEGEPLDLEHSAVKIEIHGQVDKLQTEASDVMVYGDVISISTTSGDVHCNEAANISTMSGDVTCKGRPSSVSTMSGDIKY